MLSSREHLVVTDRMYFVFLFFLLLITQCIIATTVDQCTNKTIPQPLGVRISDCDVPPCNLPRNTNVTLEIDFEAIEDVDELKTVAVAYAMGVKTTYPLPDDNVCNYLINGECPLDDGEEVTYRLTMPILSSFPKVNAIIEFSIKSGSDVICCFKVSANVVDL